MSKKRALVLLLFAFALIAAACGDDDSTTTTTAAASGGSEGTAPDLGGRTITIAVENAYLPFNYIPAGSTEPAGWDYEAFAAICETINCTPEFVQMQWDPMIDQVSQGVVDTAGDGISITDERKEKVDYSDAYMVVEQKFIARLDDDRYADSIAVIDSDAVVGTQVGTTNYELGVERVGDARIDAYEQFGVAVQALIQGDVDAVIIDDTAGQGYIGVNADQTKLLPDELQSDPLGFIYPKDSDLIDPVNAVLKDMMEDGTLDDLFKKWFVDYTP